MLAAFIGKNGSDDVGTTFYKSASMERQQFLVLHLGQSNCCATILSYN